MTSPDDHQVVERGNNDAGGGRSMSISNGKRPPQWRLYGREREQAILLNVYRQCVGTAVTKVVPQLSNSLAPTSTQLVLVEGPLGVGKRCLARSLQEPVQDGGGLFVEGSFLASQCASTYHASSNPEQAYNAAMSLQSPVFLVDVVRNVALSLDANDWDTLATGPSALSQYFTNPLESWPRLPKMMTALTAWRASWRETEGGGPERSHDALQSHWPSPPSSAILARFLGVVSTLCGLW
jgi:hypothetical protein